MGIYNVGSRVMNTYIYQAQGNYIMIDTGYEHSLKGLRSGRTNRAFHYPG